MIDQLHGVKAGEGTYTEIQDKARTTTNETVAVKDVYRNIGGVVYKTVAYSTDLVAKTTTKETTIHKTEGFLGGILEGESQDAFCVVVLKCLLSHAKVRKDLKVSESLPHRLQIRSLSDLRYVKLIERYDLH